VAAWLVALLALAALVFILPPLFARLPRPKAGSGLGNALQELNALIIPGERHVQEALKQTPAERENDEPKDP